MPYKLFILVFANLLLLAACNDNSAEQGGGDVSPNPSELHCPPSQSNE